MTIDNLTADEKRHVQQMRDGYHVVAWLHREDLESIRFDSANVTDEQMEHFVEKMGESYVSFQGFWSDLAELAGEAGICRRLSHEGESDD